MESQGLTAKPLNQASDAPAPRVRASDTAEPAASGAKDETLGQPAAAGCRAILVRGVVRPDDGVPLSQGHVIDGTHWLTLDGGAALTVKDRTSGREYRVTGPAEVRLCREGQEEVLLRAGSFESAGGPGVRPGALVLVATPHGLLTYGDGQLRLVVTGQKSEASAIAGVGQLEAPTGERLAVQAGAGPAALKANPRFGLAESLKRCRELAESAADTAKALLSVPLPRADLGPKAGKHVRERQMARGACAVALTLARGLGDSEEQRRALQTIGALDSLWRAIPPKN
jgi:hypothetical protein